MEQPNEKKPEIYALVAVLIACVFGLEATRAIWSAGEGDGRSGPNGTAKANGRATKSVPIIAATAKAMPHDRIECLAAGANDYIAKPVDVDQLPSLLRVWMPR